MNILQAIRRDLSYSVELQEQLIESATQLEFDLDAEYPNNLRIIDAEHLTDEDMEGHEYIEDGSGCKYYLMYYIEYSIPSPDYKRQILQDLARECEMEVKEYILDSAEKERGFYRWLFSGSGSDPDWNDYSLPEGAKDSYNEFIETL